MSENNKVRVGSRKSELALIQTRHVIACLKKIHPEKEFEIVTMSTLGDKVLDIPLPKIGEKSLFTRELETALITGTVDFVVHSLKDLPTVLPDGMVIGAVLEREDPRDALVLHKDCDGLTLDKLPSGSVIGTSSLRRTAQLARKYPSLKVQNIRGNLNTRLRKLDELNMFQGIILATAGLTRMGWQHRTSQIFDCSDILYAVGQGALAVECREADTQTIELLQPLYDIKTALHIIAERSFLKTLGGGCSAPVAVSSNLSEISNKSHTLSLTGAVWSLDGQEELLESDNTRIEFNKYADKCSTCPYNPAQKNVCATSDIESLCPFRKNEENCTAAKKAKLEHEKKKIPAELLKNDPHERCPVEIPIGLDFMGKCPYLESDLIQAGKCPVKGYVEGSSAEDKCPFLRDKKLNVVPTVSIPAQSSKRNSVEFCGLVPHKDVPISIFEASQMLGQQLAESLMKRGAKEIMTKAQACIRGVAS